MSFHEKSKAGAGQLVLMKGQNKYEQKQQNEPRLDTASAHIVRYKVRLTFV